MKGDLCRRLEREIECVRAHLDDEAHLYAISLSRAPQALNRRQHRSRWHAQSWVPGRANLLNNRARPEELNERVILSFMGPLTCHPPSGPCVPAGTVDGGKVIRAQMKESFSFIKKRKEKDCAELFWAWRPLQRKSISAQSLLFLSFFFEREGRSVSVSRSFISFIILEHDLSLSLPAGNKCSRMKEIRTNGSSSRRSLTASALAAIILSLSPAGGHHQDDKERENEQRQAFLL